VDAWKKQVNIQLRVEFKDDDCEDGFIGIFIDQIGWTFEFHGKNKHGICRYR
jgi:hypothetical protein